MDELGRIVIPVHIRRQLAMNVGDEFDFAVVNGGVVIQHAKPPVSRRQVTSVVVKALARIGVQVDEVLLSRALALESVIEDQQGGDGG
jgi:bifunctional DNA-binding transcriptional regulator/antitoxin component of YhaV-PrlF toxin-antitoxin module